MQMPSTFVFWKMVYTTTCTVTIAIYNYHYVYLMSFLVYLNLLTTKH